MNKQEQLDDIAAAIQRCNVCRADKHGLAVPGEGNPDADILFVGEAPGKLEAASGKPFIGRSGNLLRSLIREIGLKEEDVYITSPVKYLPDRGTPTRQDIEHGTVHLSKQIQAIDPKIIVLMGRVAVQALLKEDVQVTKMYGQFIKRDSRTYIITVHPAAALRSKASMEVLRSDFQGLKHLITELELQ